jgi:ribonuclease HI
MRTQLRFEKTKNIEGKKVITFSCAKRKEMDLDLLPIPKPLPPLKVKVKVPVQPNVVVVQKTVVASDPIVVFTDGAASNNGKLYARASYAAVFPYHSHLNKSARLQGSTQTNNRAEYMAVIVALQQAQKEDPTYVRELHIYTDSELLLKSATVWMKGWIKNGWKTKDKKPVKNKDLLVLLHELLSQRVAKWNHVRAHTGGDDWKSIWNDKADKMARTALQS